MCLAWISFVYVLILNEKIFMCRVWGYEKRRVINIPFSRFVRVWDYITANTSMEALPERQRPLRACTEKPVLRCVLCSVPYCMRYVRVSRTLGVKVWNCVYDLMNVFCRVCAAQKTDKNDLWKWWKLHTYNLHNKKIWLVKTFFKNALKKVK